MKFRKEFSLLCGLVLAGVSYGQGQNHEIIYQLSPSSPLAQAFKSALSWDYKKSNSTITVYHGFFASTNSDEGLFVECSVKKKPSPPGRGRGRGSPDYLPLTEEEGFQGCKIYKKLPAESGTAPSLTLEALILAQLPKK